MGLSRRELIAGGASVVAGAVVAAGPGLGRGRAEASTVPAYRVDVLVVGGGLGGVAAAHAAASAGRTVIMTEPTGWIGGQLTNQGIPPDEHAWIEQGLGATPTYLKIRSAVRLYVKTHYPVTDAARNSTLFNPGNGWARLDAEPTHWLAVLRSLLQPYVDGRKLTIRTGATPISVTSSTTEKSRITAVTFATKSGARFIVQPRYVVEATEQGDLLPLAGIDYRIGREKGTGIGGTGEPHNTWDYADPLSQQAFTMVAAVGYGGYQPGVPVTDALYSHFQPVYRTFGTGSTYHDVFDPSRDWAWADGRNFWQYRRVRWDGYLTDSSYGSISLLNQPENDFVEQALIPASGLAEPSSYNAMLARARHQSYGLVQYFQKEYPRPDGSGKGWRGLRLEPSILGTAYGIASVPYVRESRRIRSEFLLSERHIGVLALGDKGPPEMVDSVGTGAGPIDVHPTKTYPTGLSLATYPYQIPLRSMIPPQWSNVLAGGKTIGISHLANGAYRFHPTEWSIGEAAGHACAYALQQAIPLRRLLDKGPNFAGFAAYLDSLGILRSWPTNIAGTTVKAVRSSGG